MKIINRTEFLKLPENTLYLKCDSDNTGVLEIKVSNPDDGWKNDWVTNHFFVFTKEPYRSNDLNEFKLGDEFRWDEDQTVRDGLYETEEETMFAIFDNEDIQLVIDKLTKCLK